MISISRFLAPAALAMTALAASAAPPANVANTTWTVQINREAVSLAIATQGGPGAPGAAICRAIAGTIGIAPIRGWYCPPTGRIHFVHKNLDSGIAMRVFTGNVSDDAAGEPLYIGGTVSILASAFGNLGETNFSAVEVD